MIDTPRQTVHTTHTNRDKVEQLTHERKDMKKAEIFARVIKKWPEGACKLDNKRSGEIVVVEPRSFPLVVVGYMGAVIHEDFGSVVTRAQWEAERARILAESQPERDPDIAEIVEKACGKRSKEDQALWDKVAITLYIERVKLNSPHDGDVDLFECAFSGADAFMAERAKRMKG